MEGFKGRQQKILGWIAVASLAVGVSVAVIKLRPNWMRGAFPRTTHISGAVLRQHKDPRKQAPLANVKISATDGSLEAESKSDSSGLFRLAIPPGFLPRERITLNLEHAEYKPLEITVAPEDRLYILRLEPVNPEGGRRRESASTAKPSTIKNVRVRYTVKNQTTINVGSLAKQFEVVNIGNVPCHGKRPCSPDGKWKATVGSLSLDAEGENQFRNVRFTCIAGPCPFTTIRSDDISRPSRLINVSVLNWSDTATFLVEAEVTRTAATETVLRSYPILIGQTMTFALPTTAVGPTIEADLNGEEIVFPLGPRLILSWATCSGEVAEPNRVYRCELKPGYEFPQ